MVYKILVAEDDDDNRSILKAACEMLGYQVIVAADGGEAVNATLREKPDVILLDLAMPVMNGLDVARRIRETPSLNKIKILAVTARSLPSDIQSAKEAGCDDYILKPCDPTAILQKVAGWLSSK
jgi:CheY-like chemotaxis protein